MSAEMLTSPDDNDVTTLALYIEDVARDALGITTRSGVARVLGLHPQSWHRYIKGQNSPTITMVNGWFAALRAEGAPVPPSVEAAITAWKDGTE